MAIEYGLKRGEALAYELRNVFNRLTGGLGCRVDTYNSVMGWFDQNWPADLDWPASVPRPSDVAPRRKGRAA